jgi:hypothetical protein
MRGLRSTIALLVVLIGLGGYIYFVTNKRTPGDSGPKKEQVFAGVEADKIEELKIKSEKGDVTSLKKNGDKWEIVSPQPLPASESDLIGLTSALGQMEVVRVVDENPTDLKEYGLEQPRIEVDFKSRDGKPSGRIAFGDKTATGGNMYAKRNDDKRVFLVADFQDSSLNKSTFDLRDKTLIKIERDKVDSVTIDSGGKSVVLAKEGSDWKLTRPVAARADFSAVDGLVGRIESAQMKSVESSEVAPADLKKYGLDKPDVTVTLGQGSARAVLAFGGKSGEDAVYARDLSKPAVATVDNSLAQDLKKPPEDFRRKEAFESRAFNMTRVEFMRGADTVVFERVKGTGENPVDSWKRVSPNPGEPDKSKVEAMLAGLADIRATTFTDTIAKTGLDKPTMTVGVKFDEGRKEEKVSFGRSGSDVYALIPGQPGAAKIEAEKFDEASKALEELSK